MIATAFDYEERYYHMSNIAYMGMIKIPAEHGLDVSKLWVLGPDEGWWDITFAALAFYLDAQLTNPSRSQEKQEEDEDGYNEGFEIAWLPVPEDKAKAVFDLLADTIGASVFDDVKWEDGYLRIPFYPTELDEPNPLDVARFVIGCRAILEGRKLPDACRPADQ